MEASDEVTQTPQETDPPKDTDPFADVPAELPPEETPLPPGVEEGTLDGYNPSEDPPAEEVLEDPEAEVEEEYEPEEPPVEGEPLPPEEPVPAEEQPVEPEPEEEPEAEVEPEPEDAEQPEVPADEPDEEPEADPATAVPSSEEPEPEPDPDPDPEPEPEKPKRSRRRKSRSPDDNTKKSGDRGYVIQKQTKAGKQPQFEEAFPREKPDEPYVLWARNGMLAIRRAYHLLTGDDDAKDYVLNALPAAYYSPKKVEGRKVQQTAITVS